MKMSEIREYQSMQEYRDSAPAPASVSELILLKASDLYRIIQLILSSEYEDKSNLVVKLNNTITQTQKTR